MNEEETNLFTRPGGLFFPPGSLIVTLNVWEGRERVANAGFNPLAEDKRYLDWLNWRYIIFMPKKIPVEKLPTIKLLRRSTTTRKQACWKIPFTTRPGPFNHTS